MSTSRQKSATVNAGGVFTTSETTPVSIPGSVFDSGVTRLLTGKSSATSSGVALYPRTSRAHAAVSTEYRRMRNVFESSLAWPTTDRSSAIGTDGVEPSSPPANSAER